MSITMSMILRRRLEIKRFPKCLQTYFPGTMWTALSRSSPNCRRIDTGMPALLFLLGWDQSNPVFLKPLHFAGFSCCRRIWWIQLPFFCADPPPWSRGLDFPPHPSKSIVRCSSFDCGRQAQGDWGLGWRFLQIWGDDWKVMMVHIANQCWWLWNYNSTKGGLWQW